VGQSLAAELHLQDTFAHGVFAVPAVLKARDKLSIAFESIDG
jgi:hypothetical protein